MGMRMISGKTSSPKIILVMNREKITPILLMLWRTTRLRLARMALSGPIFWSLMKSGVKMNGNIMKKLGISSADVTKILVCSKMAPKTGMTIEAAVIKPL